jgi:hypothetical protein
MFLRAGSFEKKTEASYEQIGLIFMNKELGTKEGW